MGIISRQINKRANQELAQSVYLTTTMTNRQVADGIIELCNSMNADFDTYADSLTPAKRHWIGLGGPRSDHHYLVVIAQSEVLVSLAKEPQWIRQRPIGAAPVGSAAGWWLATVRFPKRPDIAENVVQLTLERWVSGGSNGTMKKKDRYEEFAAALATMLERT